MKESFFKFSPFRAIFYSLKITLLTSKKCEEIFIKDEELNTIWAIDGNMLWRRTWAMNLKG